jgi:hypothetical protein
MRPEVSMTRCFAIVLAVLLTACSGPKPSAAPTASPSIAASPSVAAATAEDGEGPFRLVFTLPKTTWSAGDSIDGQSRLEFSGVAPVTIVGSAGGVLGFSFAEVDGRRQMGPAWDTACAIHAIAPDKPIVSPITKSGGYGDDQPDAAFYRAFFTDPLVHLPAGEWDITAAAEFVERECGGPPHSRQASIRVRVTE